MPPIRRTPMKRQPPRPSSEEWDHGFNPEWALAPTESPAQAIPFEARKIAISNGFVAPPIQDMPVEDDQHEPLKPQDDGLFELAVTGVALLPFIAFSTITTFTTKTFSTIVGAGFSGTKAVGRSFRFNPISRGGRTPNKPKSRNSMLNLPPHMVGATPNVVRRHRGEDPRGKPGLDTPTIEQAREWSLFHNTPLPKNTRRQLLDTPRATPQGQPGTPYVPVRNAQSLTEEFHRNYRNNQIPKWVATLNKHGVTTKQLRADIVGKFSFPTESLWNGDSPGGLVFDHLVKCLSHRGFVANYRLVPLVQHPEPIPKRSTGDIDKESVTQQRDRCCRFCRGFPWAGKAEKRKLLPDGTVPVKSYHKSVKPYTESEESAFSRGDYTMMFRRWCQESRYDWLFETPDIHHPQDWKIPDDDPRLRHIAMMGNQNYHARNPKKMYDQERVDYRNWTIKTLSRQDLAAAALIKAIQGENPEFARRYELMDIERKRRQVHPEWLCIRQVKVEDTKNKPKDPPKVQVVAKTKPEKSPKNRPASNDSLGSPIAKSAKVVVPGTVSKKVKFAGEPAGPSMGTPFPKNVKGILKITNDTANIFRQVPVDDTEKAQPPSVDEPRMVLPVDDPIAQFDFTKGYTAGMPGDPLGGLPLTQIYAANMNKVGPYWDEFRLAYTAPGWKPDNLLTFEENECDRINYTIWDHAKTEREMQ
ncbi:hypothetical protein EDC01DRAFT_663616 [Geopyxis carbonaria]|nr:hypothetical protein EDC01DRAFT_663616 [Geopyxis carbonaria]